MNRRTLFKILAAIPFVRSVPFVRERIDPAFTLKLAALREAGPGRMSSMMTNPPNGITTMMIVRPPPMTPEEVVRTCKVYLIKNRKDWEDWA